MCAHMYVRTCACMHDYVRGRQSVSHFMHLPLTLPLRLIGSVPVALPPLCLAIPAWQDLKRRLGGERCKCVCVCTYVCVHEGQTRRVSLSALTSCPSTRLIGSLPVALPPLCLAAPV